MKVKDACCERVVYLNIRNIESNSSSIDFNIISFSFQYGTDYFNMLEIFKKVNIPIKRKERMGENEKNKNQYALIIAGRPCATANPYPIKIL